MPSQLNNFLWRYAKFGFSNGEIRDGKERKFCPIIPFLSRSFPPFPDQSCFPFTFRKKWTAFRKGKYCVPFLNMYAHDTQQVPVISDIFITYFFVRDLLNARPKWFFLWNWCLFLRSQFWVGANSWSEIQPGSGQTTSTRLRMGQCKNRFRHCKSRFFIWHT